MNKILIIGNAQHGKDELAKIISKKYGYKTKPSSRIAVEKFLFKILVNSYGFKYKNIDEAYANRKSTSNRQIWKKEIDKFNEIDKTRFVNIVLEESDFYTGLRDVEVLKECIKENIFDLILGVYDYRKPLEQTFNIDMNKYCDLIILNNGTKEDLEKKVNLISFIK